jgi:hypothetical protein
VSRVFASAVLVALLAATACAYALTAGDRLELSPVSGASATRVFSPGITSAAIDFRLRRSDRVTVWVTRDGRRVATVAPGRTYGPGPVRLAFDGINSSGLSLPEGTYYPAVHLGGAHRTITLPTPIVLDTTPPRISVPHRVYTHISPDGDGHGDVFRVHYTLDGSGRAILSVRGRRVEVTPRVARRGTLVWNGRVDGHVVPPGNYVLRVSARDPAGNTSASFAFAVVSVRYVRLGRTRIVASPGSRFALLVLADAPELSWLLDRARGSAGTGHGQTTLRLRAPRKPGVYRLYVTAAGHSAKALVVVA